MFKRFTEHSFITTLFTSVITAKQLNVLALFFMSVFPMSVFSNTALAEPARLSGIIASHNKVRAKHSLPPLKWSNALAGYAQQWANELSRNRNCSMIHRPNYGIFKQRFGENLFWASPEEWSNGVVKIQQFSAPEIVKAWADEEAYYNYRTNQCKAGEDCGHYTQMVWEESRNVGCAIVVCPNKAQIWACNYDPPGNYIGERPY